MLVEEETLVNSEYVPGMSVGDVASERYVGLGNGGVGVDLGVETGSTIWYKILLGVLGALGVILALAVLFKIIGGCKRTSENCSDDSFNEKLECFFMGNYMRGFKLNREEDAFDVDAPRNRHVAFVDNESELVDGEFVGPSLGENSAERKECGAAYKVTVTALCDIRDGVLTVKNGIVGLFKTKSEIEERVFFDGFGSGME